MDAQLKAKWVEALRSDEYTQARKEIGDYVAKHLCCLGVGAHVANPDMILSCTADATKELEKHGFPKTTDQFGQFDGEALRLIKMNDEQEKSFAEIADYIEANL